MKRRYIGWSNWRYILPDMTTGTVDIKIPEGDYAADEGMARYYVRKRYGLKKLPRGTKVYPDYPPS